MKLTTMLKKPSGFLPVTMSLAALAIVVIHIALYGVGHEADEGASAHLWQILMAAQLPLVLLFAVRWYPHSPKQAVQVMALQAAAGIASLAPVYFFKL
jgi:FtsH-binding integral membrane protein